jgi:cysteinyl-tRNA synthetase
VSKFVAVTDEDLARARKDRAFRQTLLASSLDQLLSAMNKLKRDHPDASPAMTRQIREAVELAVKLADRIRKIA